MNTKEIADALCAHCRNHTEAEGLKTLYAGDAVSVEAMSPEGMDPVSRGREAIQGKHDWWNSNMTVHSMDFEGPFINGDRFSVVFEIDAEDKASGQRWKAKEVALYEVENGKIARETFFMAPME